MLVRSAVKKDGMLTFFSFFRENYIYSFCTSNINKCVCFVQTPLLIVDLNSSDFSDKSSGTAFMAMRGDRIQELQALRRHAVPNPSSGCRLRRCPPPPQAYSLYHLEQSPDDSQDPRNLVKNRGASPLPCELCWGSAGREGVVHSLRLVWSVDVDLCWAPTSAPTLKRLRKLCNFSPWDQKHIFRPI